MDYKRQYREPSDETKQKISTALKNRPKSSSHKQHISQGLKSYWGSVPSKNQNNGITTTEKVV